MIVKIDSYLDSFKIGKNAAVDRWPLMSGPMPLIFILLSYLVFVLRLGPKIMRKRPPMQLNRIIIAYNVAQVLLSVWVCYKSIRLNLFKDGILFAGCSYPSTTQDIMLLDCGWWYFFAKVTELLDTVFFVLRKKDKQVTFLHVYHHTIMAAFAWSYLKFAAGGQGAVLGFMNSSVHVVMYTYYLLAALGPAVEKYLWWKKYVTTMQMVQFILMLTYCVGTNLIPSCSFPKSFTYFITANIMLFFVMFFSFYVKTYNKKNCMAQKEAKDAHKCAYRGSFCNGKDNMNNISCNGSNGKNFTRRMTNSINGHRLIQN